MTYINPRNDYIPQSNTYLCLLRKNRLAILERHPREELSSHPLQSHRIFSSLICQLLIEGFHSVNFSKSRAKATISMVEASPQGRFTMHTTKKRRHILDPMTRKSKTCKCGITHCIQKIYECPVIWHPFFCACACPAYFWSDWYLNFVFCRDVWDVMMCHQVCNSWTWHVFKEPPKAV